MITAKDQASFRKTNDIMVQSKKGQKVIANRRWVRSQEARQEKIN